MNTADFVFDITYQPSDSDVMLHIIKNRGTTPTSNIQRIFEDLGEYCVYVTWNRKSDMTDWLTLHFGDPATSSRWYWKNVLVIAFKSEKDRTWFLLQNWNYNG